MTTHVNSIYTVVDPNRNWADFFLQHKVRAVAHETFIEQHEARPDGRSGQYAQT